MNQAYVPSTATQWERTEHAPMAKAIAEISGWESTMSRDIAAFKLNENMVEYAEGEHGPLIGPLPARGPATGVVLHRGRILGEWGTPDRPDIAFSVTKSFLSTLAGMALDDGLIPSLDSRVAQTITAPEFASAPNNAITWRHFLTLTSEWSGSLWTIPDRIDFNRAVPKRPDAPPKGTPRERRSPGQYWEFNDVRVNVLALALTHLFGESLEDVLRRRVMDPIGAGGDWQWNGYHNSEIALAGRKTKVVAGGAHWGGGVIMSAFDLARLALLHARRGVWGDAKLLSPLWFDALRSPCWLNPAFGLMWWNNLGGTIPALSPQAIWGSGISNFLVCDPGHDLVIVMRWYDLPRRDQIIARITSALPA